METSGEIFRRERRLVAEDSEASRNDRPRNASCKCSARCARQRVAHVRAYLTHRRGAAWPQPQLRDEARRALEKWRIAVTSIRGAAWTGMHNNNAHPARIEKSTRLDCDYCLGRCQSYVTPLCVEAASIAASSSRQSFTFSISTDETLNDGCFFTFEIALHRCRDNVRRK